MWKKTLFNSKFLFGAGGPILNTYFSWIPPHSQQYNPTQFCTSSLGCWSMTSQQKRQKQNSPTKEHKACNEKTEELCPFYLFVFFWDSFVRMMEKFLLISCLPTGIWRTQAQAFFAASHLSHEFTSEQMRLKWVEQEFASVPCGKIQWKVVVFFLVSK